MGIRNKKKEEKEELSREVLHRYKNRLTFLKQGKEYYKNEDFVNASRCYNSYLQVLSDYKQVDVKKLSPSLFDKETELSEMLLISHVFWDLAKIYDRTPKLLDELGWVLNSFVRFTTGFKFQVLNAGMIRRFIKAKKVRNKEIFEDAAEKIHVASKKCFVASYAYSEEHPYTVHFRELREKIIAYKLGELFVRSYYKTSPFLVNFLEKNKFISKFFKKIFARPILKFLYKMTKEKEIQY